MHVSNLLLKSKYVLCDEIKKFDGVTLFFLLTLGPMILLVPWEYVALFTFWYSLADFNPSIWIDIPLRVAALLIIVVYASHSFRKDIKGSDTVRIGLVVSLLLIFAIIVLGLHIAGFIDFS